MNKESIRVKREDVRVESSLAFLICDGDKITRFDAHRRLAGEITIEEMQRDYESGSFIFGEENRSSANA